eukprot:scaffold917_cov31-Phaeocystis_antarctica.AAC.2
MSAVCLVRRGGSRRKGAGKGTRPRPATTPVKAHVQLRFDAQRARLVMTRVAWLMTRTAPRWTRRAAATRGARGVCAARCASRAGRTSGTPSVPTTGLPDNVPLDVLARMPNRKAQQRPTPATQSILNATAAPREVAPKSNLMVPRRRHAASMSNATIRHCSRLAGRGCVELSDPAADGPGKCRGMPRGTRPSNGATHGPPPTNL